MFFSIHTLGCKLNQLETEAITDAFSRYGFDGPDAAHNAGGEDGIVIVNTCTVTSMAEQKARRLIRRLLADYPRACLIITGCYAQLDRDLLEKEFSGEAGAGGSGGRGGSNESVVCGGCGVSGTYSDSAGTGVCGVRGGPCTTGAPGERVFVLEGDKKDLLLDLPRFIMDYSSYKSKETKKNESSLHTNLLPLRLCASVRDFILESSGARQKDGSFRFKPEKFAAHSRAFLKIQDGCDRRCTYCRVSLARGKSEASLQRKLLRSFAPLKPAVLMKPYLPGLISPNTETRETKLRIYPGFWNTCLREPEKSGSGFHRLIPILPYLTIGSLKLSQIKGYARIFTFPFNREAKRSSL